MSKCSTKSMAIAMAAERGKMYGVCVFDGKWYVGSKLELDSVGVVTPQEPNSPACPVGWDKI